MPLSSNLVSQFVKATKDNKKETTKETTVYGKLVEQKDGRYYVQLDGSDVITPISQFTTHVNKDERVTVMIKNHTAIVTGNISSPAAGTEYVNTTVDEKLEKLSSIPITDIKSLWNK